MGQVSAVSFFDWARLRHRRFVRRVVAGVTVGRGHLEAQKLAVFSMPYPARMGVGFCFGGCFRFLDWRK